MVVRPSLVVLLAIGLGACGDGREGTSISINASGADGNVVAAMDKGGQVSVNLPGGIAGNIKLPKLKFDADDFDMNGVHLFPGSTISALNIDTRDGQEFEDNDGSVHLSFESPADPARVRDWFREKLSAAGFTLKTDGDGLTGTTDEKQPFKLELAPSGDGKSAGTTAIG